MGEFQLQKRYIPLSDKEKEKMTRELFKPFKYQNLKGAAFMSGKIRGMFTEDVLICVSAVLLRVRTGTKDPGNNPLLPGTT